MNKLTGTILTLPKMSGNVGAKTINIGGKGDDGATFIPSVSADGIISWTNDQDLPNPEPVNIKGAKGDKGDPGTNGKDGYTPVKGVDYFDGKDGKDGSPGVDGVTPHVGSNGNWFVGEDDTGIPATGPAGGQGLPGTPGEDGKPGADGSDGVSATHSWNGTTLTITSASGTSSADLKGEKGFSPIVTTERDELIGLTKVSILDEQGEDIFLVHDGHTPQKGIDYFTHEECEDMEAEVYNAIINSDSLQSNLTELVKIYIERELLGGAW